MLSPQGLYKEVSRKDWSRSAHSSTQWIQRLHQLLYFLAFSPFPALSLKGIHLLSCKITNAMLGLEHQQQWSI